jgi:hypothetical protein
VAKTTGQLPKTRLTADSRHFDTERKRTNLAATSTSAESSFIFSDWIVVCISSNPKSEIRGPVKGGHTDACIAITQREVTDQLSSKCLHGVLESLLLGHLCHSCDAAANEALPQKLERGKHAPSIQDEGEAK